MTITSMEVNTSTIAHPQNIPGEDARLLRVREIARRLDVCPQTVRRWITEGRLPAVRPTDHTLRVRASEFEKFLSEGAQND